MEHHGHPIKVDALALDIENQRENFEGLKLALAQRKKDLLDFEKEVRDAEHKLAELEAAAT
jgi:hypothetical protein